MNTYHYTYLITDLLPVSEKRYYIGVRSCECDPEEDAYMSSSAALKEIDNKQLNKTVIQQWDSREEAVAHEIFLHEQHDVKTNPMFYNQANQLSNGFDRTGTTYKQSKKAIENTRKGKLIGTYHTPFGSFTSTLDQDVIPNCTLSKWCCYTNDKKISNISYGMSKYLQSLGKEVIGKTYKEIGFEFTFKK